MKYTFILTILFMSMTMISKTWAAESQVAVLSLNAAITEAENNSPDLQRLGAAAERISWGKREALSNHMPKISLGYDHYFDSVYMRENILFGGSIVNFPAAYPEDTFTLDASLTVFDGLDSYYKYRAADLNTDAANLDLQRAKFQVEQKVRLAFFQALAAQKLYEVALQNVRTLEDHLQRAKITEHAGYGTNFDVLRIEATLEEARADAEQAENNIQITRDALVEAMGMDHDDHRDLIGELPVLKESDIPKDLQIQVSDRQDVQSQMKKEDAARALRSAAHSFWYPSVAIFAEQQYYEFGNFDPAIASNSSYQNAYAFGLRLRWNIFDGGYSYAKQQEANQAVIESQNETRKVLQQLPREVDTWRRKFNYSVSLYRARLRALAQFQESVRLASIGVKAGSRTHTEMLDAEQDLFRARGGLVKAQAEAVEALGNLELAVGHKIWSP